MTSNFLGFDFDLWPSEVTLGCDSKAQVISYVSSIDTVSLSLTVFEIFAFKVCRLRPWPFSLYRNVFEIFDYKVIMVWPWPLTFRGHLRPKIFLPFESPYMTSYLTSIDTFSLSRTVFEIFDFKVFRIWPWPLTFKGHLRSKIFMPFESPYMTSCLTSLNTFSPSRTVFEILDFKVFTVWPWPLTLRGHLRPKIFMPFESSYMTSYLTSIDTFSLSRIVFEIFDFKVFRVWPLTFRGHLRSKIFMPFESPYMTSYLTSIDTFSLSRTVFEIFDIKVFRVWPWPLTFRDHLRSKIFLPFESPYMTSYLTSIDTFSLSRTVFWDLWLQSFYCLTLTFDL